MPAAPQGRSLIKERAAQLRARGEAAMTARMSSLNGTTQTLLVERGGIGRTECFAPARIDAPPGTFMTAADHHGRGAQTNSWIDKVAA